MKPQFTEKDIRMAAAYGMGVVAGKHNLKFPKKEIKETARMAVKLIKAKKCQ